MNRYQVKKGLVVQCSDGIFVAYDATKGTILELNKVGFRIVEACAKPTSVESVCRKLEAEFQNVPPQRHLAREVCTFLTELEKSGFIRAV